MAKKKADDLVTTRGNLLAVLRTCETEVPAKILNLINAEKEANAAMREFEESNLEYRSLNRACRRASTARIRAEARLRDSRRTKLRGVRNAVLIRGVTSETIQMVEKLAKEMA